MENKMLANLVLTFIFSYTSASSEIKEVFACQNQEKTLDFGYDISPHATVTYKKYEDMKSYILKATPKLVASEHIGIKTYYPASSDSRLVILPNRNLYFNNVSTLDDGLYIREISNGDTHQVNFLLKVYVSPIGIPKIKNFTDSKGYVYLKCEGLLDLGKPKATLVIKDSMDRIMDELSYTINDDVYKCCLEGESVQKCYPKDIPTCASYNIKKKTPDETITTGVLCKSYGDCKMVAILVWYACFVFLLVLIILEQTSGIQTDASICQCPRTDSIASKFKDKYFLINLSTKCGVSILAIVLSSGYFCSKADCGDPFYQCLIGFLCSLVLYFGPAFRNMKRARTRSLEPESETVPLMDDVNQQEPVPYEKEVEFDQPGTHNAEDRKQLRKYRKIDVLRKGISHVFWNANQKEEIKHIFTPEYMSSEESEYEEDAQTRRKALKRYKIKRIPWENKKVTTLKERLRYWYEVYEGKSRYEHEKIERIQCEEVSKRRAPKYAPDWAIEGSSSHFLEFLTSDTVQNTRDFS